MIDSFACSGKSIKHGWLLLDANGQTLGRLATKAANLLRGKHKTSFTTNLDHGDYVIIINAEKVKLTGNKLDQKFHHRYTGYVGNLKSIPYRIMMEKAPEKVVKIAIQGMLPKGRLGRNQIVKLRVYRGAEHEHVAQNPKALKV